VIVDHAMRYGKPAIRDRIEALKGQGCERILIAPLYPQYCAATTATANDEAFLHLRRMRWQPAVRTLPPYYEDVAYIAALKHRLEEGLAALDFAPEAILASFHGMPERTLHLGDPYHCHCRKTARLLSEASGRELIVTFQSRFGRAKWLEPATDTTLAALPGRGVRKVAIFAPGFSADCLETLEELAIRGRETFSEAGGTDFAYLPCLNDSPAGMEMLRSIISRELMAGYALPKRASKKTTGEANMARVAIVTGGTRGIGEAISVALRDAGVTVAALCRQAEKGARVHLSAPASRLQVGDVCGFRRWRRWRAAVESELGRSTSSSTTPASPATAP
jgi:ferrochelatase